jgi:hypothetical protein
MAKLFLLNPNFIDPNIDTEEQLYYCPHCALIEGIISYYPKLKDNLQIYYVDFPRPRNQIIELIGEENQSCPVLILDTEHDVIDTSYFKSYNGNLFINSTDLITKYLADNFNIACPHP